MENIKSSNKFSNLAKWQFALLMTLMVTVWALAFPLIKTGLKELSFINLTIMRFLFVCITLATILVLKSSKFSKLHKKDILPIFILGFFGVMVYHIGLNYGEQFISPGAASLIIATIPIIIVILAAVFLKEKITWKKILGVLLAFGGVLIISMWGRPEATIEINYISGAIAVLIAAIMGAFYTIAGKKLLERYTALSLTVYAMLFGSLGLIPLISTSLFNEVATLSTDAWFAIIFLGLFSTVIGYLLWYLALEIKTASELSVYLYAIPVLSTIVSYFWFDDKITIMFVLGGALVIIGLAIVNMKNKTL